MLQQTCTKPAVAVCFYGICVVCYVFYVLPFGVINDDDDDDDDRNDNGVISVNLPLIDFWRPLSESA